MMLVSSLKASVKRLVRSASSVAKTACRPAQLTNGVAVWAEGGGELVGVGVAEECSFWVFQSMGEDWAALFPFSCGR